MNPPPSLAHFVSLDSPLKGATPTARQSRFRGVSRTGLAAPALEFRGKKKAGGCRLFQGACAAYLTCLPISAANSNIETCGLPKISFSLASALMLRLLALSCRPFFLM